ncbi:hypothetical protein A2715_04240 [Candidatus Woesebacteria bacterium RIFCSPHIGHO2_01_FULL_39_32]|uniref:Uncharacterized protein n=1 Tax=Candidatus Woesebacteria bacterium RIFCSPLOWO2_01_FULL_39_25 TaxID=1802521 RepID=A0A1F8BLC4_9BACT|nr:MAG: hypothetical protein A2124_04635 [Candidatus Woesebacteria bacterium GWB1_37_5]OGM25228.1 MAG: hypothetical protein A2715_04240 [Candidatus Woesebacteria bacterium RIFCSPHIGHO2_01_FULL_39_32]OGM37728.1 MAG: hypothetical protein A3F01_01450 [Candidatus Woesebacteria bacterium RIFCSPHIGHO2_12_FULL_38_11]OGM64760.1 MAG: hypothetical protein A2893_03850 [Candidatus Woesebacteria bacterium RIFCSPLOWO2_01_FULL_39_25]
MTKKRSKVTIIGICVGFFAGLIVEVLVVGVWRNIPVEDTLVTLPRAPSGPWAIGPGFALISFSILGGFLGILIEIIRGNKKI